MSEQAGRYQRSAAGMVGAMIVLVVVVVFMVFVRDASNTRAVPDPTPTVDYRQTVDYARRTADFDLLAPRTLPAGWRATSVSFVPRGDQRWHLGMLTGTDGYVGLEQAGRSVSSMVEQYVDPEAARGGTVEIGGSAWQTFTDSGGDTALVRRQGDITTLVVGTVDRDVLVDFVKSLR